jgi:hypothetical protein
MEKVRKELGTEFADLFGNQPIRAMDPKSVEYQRLVALENEMVFLANLLHMRGDKVPDVDATFARRAMAASDRREFQDALSRSARRNLKNKVNGMAKGATPKPAPRREDRGGEEFDPQGARERALAHARQRERTDETGTAAQY